MTRKFVSAVEAVQWGFVTKVVPPDKVMEAAFELADELKKMPPLSLRAVKKAVNQGMQGYELAEYIMDSLQKSSDAAEGTSAFLEKREPAFAGK